MSDATLDRLYRFDFEHLAVRGALVRLDRSWRAVRGQHDYPDRVSELLGEALVCVTLVRAGIKTAGRLSLQLRSRGSLRLLSAECDEAGHVRGMARYSTGAGQLECLSELPGDSVLSVQLEPVAGGMHYQGLVPLAGPGMAAAVEGYFTQSEQLATRVWAQVEQGVAAGLLLQALPADRALSADDWRRLGYQLDTLTAPELRDLAPGTLLQRLFPEDTIRLFPGQSTRFACSCSRARVARVLLRLGEAECEQIIAEWGHIAVDCEHCHAHYEFDPIDTRQLFMSEDPAGFGSSRQH